MNRPEQRQQEFFLSFVTCVYISGVQVSAASALPSHTSLLLVPHIPLEGDGTVKASELSHFVLLWKKNSYTTLTCKEKLTAVTELNKYLNSTAGRAEFTSVVSDARHERKSVLVYFSSTLQRSSKKIILVSYILWGFFLCFFFFDLLEYITSPRLLHDEFYRPKALFPPNRSTLYRIIIRRFTSTCVLHKHLRQEFFFPACKETG